MSKLIFGCGYLGMRVAQRWVMEGHQVYAVTRRPSRAEILAAAGIRPIVADVTLPDSLVLPSAKTVLFSVGFDRTTGHDIHDVYVKGLGNVLSRLHPDTGRFVYVSSTGVYGQTDGDWVDESSPCEPVRVGGKACLAAERLIADHWIGSKAVILRLAGIYGPGRVPRKKDLITGSLSAPTKGHVNLIHVEDAADIICTADLKANVPVTYLVSDGYPVLRRDYYDEICRLLGLGRVQFSEPEQETTQVRRAQGDKRIRSDRCLAELEVSLKYPDYRAGLAAIMTER